MTVTPAIKSGVRTTEFWASSVAPIVLAALTFYFHKDFSGYVQAASVAAAGVSTAVYAISRAHLKRPVDLATALYDLKALLPVGKDAEEVVVEVKKALPKKAKPAAPAAPVAPVDKQAGHTQLDTVLIVLAAVGVLLLLLGVTFR